MDVHDITEDILCLCWSKMDRGCAFSLCNEYLESLCSHTNHAALVSVAVIFLVDAAF